MSASTLALLGGTPVVSKPRPAYNTIGAAEKAAVMEVLDCGELSGFVASPDQYFWGGKQVRAIEEAFKRHFGVKHAIAVNSATSGLHCATMATGIGPGDEVIVSPYTMTASATSIIMCGALPVFADIEPDTFGLDPTSVEANITPNTRGIMAVNIFGHGARLAELRAIADRHGLFLIEDNAQAPDALYRGAKTGTIGDAGVFSLNRHKTMQCGEGGVVITNDDKIALKLALMRNHGEVIVGPMGIDDIVNTVGLNYRMGEMEAAVGQVQFAKLPELNRQRIELANCLTARLSELPGITPPKVETGCSHVYYMYVSKMDEAVVGIPRDLFAAALTAEGVPMRAGYLKPIYLEPMYQRRIAFGRNGFPFSAHPRQVSYDRGICPLVEHLQDHEVLLTSVYPPMTVADMGAIADAFDKVMENRDALRAHQASK